MVVTTRRGAGVISSIAAGESQQGGKEPRQVQQAAKIARVSEMWGVRMA